MLATPLRAFPPMRPPPATSAPHSSPPAAALATIPKQLLPPPSPSTSPTSPLLLLGADAAPTGEAATEEPALPPSHRQRSSSSPLRMPPSTLDPTIHSKYLVLSMPVCDAASGMRAPPIPPAPAGSADGAAPPAVALASICCACMYSTSNQLCCAPFSSVPPRIPRGSNANPTSTVHRAPCLTHRATIHNGVAAHALFHEAQPSLLPGILHRMGSRVPGVDIPWQTTEPGTGPPRCKDVAAIPCPPPTPVITPSRHTPQHATKHVRLHA